MEKFEPQLQGWPLGGMYNRHVHSSNALGLVLHPIRNQAHTFEELITHAHDRELNIRTSCLQRTLVQESRLIKDNQDMKPLRPTTGRPLQ